MEYAKKYEFAKLTPQEEFLKMKEIFQGVAPETKLVYANVNFILCALIIESVTKLPYAEYMKKEVFEPLGVKNAVVYQDGIAIENLTTGYFWREEDETIVPTIPATRWLFGAGDIFGTVDDIYRLNIAIKEKLLLKEETWEMALTPSKLGAFGMGCAVVNWHGKRSVRHNGGHTGYRSFHMQILEDDFDIILLSNSGWGNIRKDFADTIYELFYGEPSLRDNIEMDTGYI